MKVRLPQVGESVTEAYIGPWLKSVGDRIEKYEPVVEIVTDKVTMEMPSPATGVLSAIVVAEGQTVPMGAVIAEIEVEGEEPEEREDAPAVVPGAASEASLTGTLLKDVAPVGPTGSGGPAVTGDVSGPRYSPAVRRLAAEHGVDLSAVRGSGIGGRVTRRDVEAHVAQQTSRTPAGETASADEERVPLTPVRRTIADNMVRSVSQIPEAWSTVEADVTGLVALREAVKSDFRGREGVNLTFMAFFVQAVAAALKENPLVNSTWGGDAIVLKRRVNVGVAVAAPQGLVVPIVHDADAMDVASLARTVDDLAARARAGKLRVEDMRGGTFTLNNTGALGSVVGKGIINHPQAAILNAEAIVKRPVVVDDEVAVRSMMNLCITFDHRILDGAEAAAFVNAVKSRLEAIGPDTVI